jgi:hypothetical protein
VYAITRVQVIQDDLKLNGTHQFPVYADDNTLVGSVYTIKKIAEPLVAPSKETGLEVYADKNTRMHMVMSEDHYASRSHVINIPNSSFGKVQQIKRFGTTLTYQTSIQENTESRLKSGNDCYHSIHNLLSSNMLSKDIEIKT